MNIGKIELLINEIKATKDTISYNENNLKKLKEGHIHGLSVTQYNRELFNFVIREDDLVLDVLTDMIEKLIADEVERLSGLKQRLIGEVIIDPL